MKTNPYVRSTEGIPIKIITINLPEKYIEAIQVLNDLAIYPSRSEAVRVALRDFLTNEFKLSQEIEEDHFKMLIRSTMRR